MKEREKERKKETNEREREREKERGNKTILAAATAYFSHGKKENVNFAAISTSFRFCFIANKVKKLDAWETSEYIVMTSFFLFTRGGKRETFAKITTRSQTKQKNSTKISSFLFLAKSLLVLFFSFLPAPLHE